jgi:hypothetical protein
MSERYLKHTRGTRFRKNRNRHTFITSYINISKNMVRNTGKRLAAPCGLKAPMPMMISSSLTRAKRQGMPPILANNAT